MLANAFFKADKADYEDNRWMEMDAYFGGNPQWWSYNAYYFNDKGFLDGTSVNIKSAADVSKPITRYDMVQIVTNILDSKNISVSSADKANAQRVIADWSDVPVKYHNAVSTCFSLGIISGYTGNRFVGTDSLTRAQACVILNTLVDVVAKGGSAKPPVTEPDEPKREPIYEYCTCTCDACKDCQGTVVGYKPSVTPSAKDVEVTTMTSQWGTGYYVKDNGFGTGKLNNGKPITEANVLEMLAEAEKIWPTGTSWKKRATYDNHWYEWSGPVVDSVLLSKYGVSTNYACGGFAAMLSDYVFGQTGNPFHRVYDETDLRPGDIVVELVNNKPTHVAFVIVANNGAICTGDGNVSSRVSWSHDTPTKLSEYDAIWNYLHPDQVRTYEFWSRYPA